MSYADQISAHLRGPYPEGDVPYAARVEARAIAERADEQIAALTAERDRLRKIIDASAQEAHDALYGPGMDGEPWAMRGALMNVIARADLRTADEGEGS